jgi:hypothetical protein
MRRTKAAAAMAALACTLATLSGAPAKQIDLATVITKTDAEAALGEAVKDPEPRNGDGADGYYSRCNYYSENPGKSLVLRVRQASAGQLEPKKQLEELSAANSKIKPLPKLGDQAAVMIEEGKGPSHMLMLYVTKKDAFITVGISGLDDDKAALERARKIARKILAQL